MNVRPDNRTRLQLWMLGLIFLSILGSFLISVLRMAEFSHLAVSNPTKLLDLIGVREILPNWQGSVLQRLIENIFALYGAILVIMLTNFFTATSDLLDQPVHKTQATVAIALFGIVQLVNIAVFYYAYGPGLPITSSVTAFQSAVLNTLLGIAVGFSFPDKPKGTKD